MGNLITAILRGKGKDFLQFLELVSLQLLWGIEQEESLLSVDDVSPDGFAEGRLIPIDIEQVILDLEG